MQGVECPYTQISEIVKAIQGTHPQQQRQADEVARIISRTKENPETKMLTRHSGSRMLQAKALRAGGRLFLPAEMAE